MEDKQARAVALWALAAHAFDAFVIFPRLLATAPEKGCGKSTLLDVIGNLIPKPLKAELHHGRGAVPGDRGRQAFDAAGRGRCLSC